MSTLRTNQLQTTDGLTTVQIADLVDKDQLFAAAGAGTVGFLSSETYPNNTVGFQLQTLLKRSVFVSPRGAGLDDAANINAVAAAAGAGADLFFEDGDYEINASLVQVAGQAWRGTGGQRGTRFNKKANCDMFLVADRGAVLDITLNNAGTLYTGRGFYVTSGFSQYLFRCRSVQSKGPSLEFAANIGGGANIIAFEGDTIDQDTVGAVRIAGDNNPHPRFFNGLWLSGGFIDLASPGAGNGNSFSNFYIRNVKTVGPVATGTALCHFANGRMASIADTTTLSGSDITMVGVAFSGPVALVNMQGFKSSACTFGAGITEDFATCRFNEYSDQVKTFSSTWTQASGTQPAIGNGSITGRFSRQGYLVHFQLKLTVGSTTTFGNSTTSWQFQLPVGGTQNSTQDLIATAQCWDVSATTEFLANGQIAAGSNLLTLSRNGAGIRDGFPFSWAVGDTITFSGTYLSI